MSNTYFTVLTDTGRAKIAAAHADGSSLKLDAFVIGDGENGAAYEPTSAQTALKNAVYQAQANRIRQDTNNPSWLIIEAIVPHDQGPFWVREVGVLDEDGDLIVVAKYPETYKPAPSEVSGLVRELHIEIIMEVADAANVTLTVDPSAVVATREYVDATVTNTVSDAISAAIDSGEVNKSLLELGQVAPAGDVGTFRTGVLGLGAINHGPVYTGTVDPTTLAAWGSMPGELPWLDTGANPAVLRKYVAGSWAVCPTAPYDTAVAIYDTDLQVPIDPGVTYTFGGDGAGGYVWQAASGGASNRVELDGSASIYDIEANYSTEFTINAWNAVPAPSSGGGVKLVSIGVVPDTPTGGVFTIPMNVNVGHHRHFMSAGTSGWNEQLNITPFRFELANMQITTSDAGTEPGGVVAYRWLRGGSSGPIHSGGEDANSFPDTLVLGGGLTGAQFNAPTPQANPCVAGYILTFDGLAEGMVEFG